MNFEITAHITTTDSVFWQWEPSVFLGCGFLLLVYLMWIRFKFSVQVVWFVAGVGALLLALVSFLHTLGDTYLFSAHMLQHLILVQVVPPLLLLGLPPKRTCKLLRRKGLRLLEHILGWPPVAWLIGVTTLGVWHWPKLYDAAVFDHNLHIFQHLTLLVSATIFWWPVLAPVPERRFGHLATMLYLLAAAIASSLLGAFLTFMPGPLYQAYVNPHDDLRLLFLLRDEWGLSPAIDQQLGGLFMWVLGGPGYLAGVLVVLARWFGEANASRQAELARLVGEEITPASPNLVGQPLETGQAQ